MNNPTTMLKADHREVKRMLSTLAESDEGAERRQLCEQLATALTLHMEIEETLIYPLVGQQVGREDEEEAEIEHRLAREGLTKVVDMVDKPGFGAAVQMLAGGITHHVEEEEGEVLPSLKDAMGQAAWAELGDAIAEKKAAAGMPVESSSPRRRSAKRSSSNSRK